MLCRLRCQRRHADELSATVCSRAHLTICSAMCLCEHMPHAAVASQSADSEGTFSQSFAADIRHPIETVAMSCSTEIVYDTMRTSPVVHAASIRALLPGSCSSTGDVAPAAQVLTRSGQQQGHTKPLRMLPRAQHLHGLSTCHLQGQPGTVPTLHLMHELGFWTAAHMDHPANDMKAASGSPAGQNTGPQCRRASVSPVQNACSDDTRLGVPKSIWICRSEAHTPHAEVRGNGAFGAFGGYSGG